MKYLVLYLCLSACGQGVAPYENPLIFQVGSTVERFEICTSVGRVSLIERGRVTKIWTAQLACIDESVGFLDPIVLLPGMEYQAQSDVHEAEIFVTGFEPVLAPLDQVPNPGDFVHENIGDPRVRQ